MSEKYAGCVLFCHTCHNKWNESIEDYPTITDYITDLSKRGCPHCSEVGNKGFVEPVTYMNRKEFDLYLMIDAGFAKYVNWDDGIQK